MNELVPFTTWQPFETYETKLPIFRTTEEPERYVVTAELPGFKPEEVKVGVVGNQIKIEGKHEEKGEEKGTTYQRFGTFERIFTLPENVVGENIKAEMENGLLKLVLPKAEAVKPKEIPIAAAPKPVAEPVKPEPKAVPVQAEEKPA
jgi:HSP20 family protein